MASTTFKEGSTSSHIDPTETYYGRWSASAPVKLRIASGGAGQSGLLRALADGFINHEAKKAGAEPFAIEWYASDTTQSFNYLAQNVADISITYHVAAEETAIRQGIADRYEYCFRDHWMLVGPKSNPARLRVEPDTDIYDLLIQLFVACINTLSSKNPIRFLSRYDKSAANIKESNLWSAIGQTPWSYPYSHWYHRYVEFPFKALQVAAQLEEYTLTDKGTWYSIDPCIREKMTVFIVGGDTEEDPLLNPAHGLVGKYATNKAMANHFLDWVIGLEGQAIFETFSAGGVVLYSPAPARDITSSRFRSRL